MHKRRACHGARSAPWSAHSVVKHAQKSVCTNYEVPTGALDSRASANLMRMFKAFNEGGQTILMVTHSAQAAAYATRVLFIKDGELFNQLYKGDESDREFFERIMSATTVLEAGGESFA